MNGRGRTGRGNNELIYIFVWAPREKISVLSPAPPYFNMMRTCVYVLAALVAVASADCDGCDKLNGSDPIAKIEHKCADRDGIQHCGIQVRISMI